ncbi:unnamed protein product [Phaedon cochleariae]|uniref:Integrase core domain-containing protein n=1 Tax=Phaedon cochleariae TaxID=80249 RepID=A0A9N9SL72_PHACE|nr:unnamed protein product [Phaedon cochleariae]
MSDKIASYYSTSRKTIKLYKKVALEIIFGTMVVNAWVMQKKFGTDNSVTILQFRESEVGFNLSEIKAFLMLRHDILISERQLKRYLKQLNLYRRKNYTDLRIISDFIDQQILGSGSLHGYRWMHLECLQNGSVVKMNTVRRLLKKKDPEGVELRSRNRLRRRAYHNKLPNYMWHVDSYDKLKPYGIAINGCVDGFSRRIMWLRAAKSNNNPRIIAGYYIESVETLGGSPQTLRRDMGTENCWKAGFLMRKTGWKSKEKIPNTNILPAHLYGTSPHNQRIESWWSILRKHNSQYWMNTFEQLKDDNFCNGTDLDKALIQLCFMEIIQGELDEIIHEWNNHRISNSRNNRAPLGKPNVLFNVPELYYTHDYLVEVTNREIETRRSECLFVQDITIISDFIDQQILGSGSLHEYRWMHLKCLQNGLVVKMNTVRRLLKEKDPEGVELRSRNRLRRRAYNKGPNYMWHVDSYDKLKPYGIAINGCVDGFSRRIMWLGAAKSNNNPRIIAGYYIE